VSPASFLNKGNISLGTVFARMYSNGFPGLVNVASISSAIASNVRLDNENSPPCKALLSGLVMFLCFKNCQQIRGTYFFHILQLWNFGLLTSKTDSTIFLLSEYIFCGFRGLWDGEIKLWSVEKKNTRRRPKRYFIAKKEMNSIKKDRKNKNDC
jgi:hypothetical protein